MNSPVFVNLTRSARGAGATTTQPFPAPPGHPSRLATAWRAGLVAACLFLLPAVPRVQAIVFPDPQLEKALRGMIFKPVNEELTAEDLSQLTFLRLQPETPTDEPIRNLEGLQAATNLTVLQFAGLIGYRPDGSAVGPFTAIDLPEGGLDVLGALDKLTFLTFEDCQLPSLVLPSSLTALNQFRLANCGTTSLVIPDTLTNLTGLSLVGNKLDLAVPGTLPANPARLESLDIEDVPGVNLAWLDMLPGLKSLELANVGLTNLILPDAVYSRLKSLHVSRSPKLKDFGFLARFTALKSLGLTGNGMASFAPPASLAGLESLNLGENLLTSTPFLDQLPGLTLLELGVNRLTSLVIPPAMTNLGTLGAAGNPSLTKLVIPEGSGRLAVITLAGNQLKELVIPRGCTNLYRLQIVQNPLTRLVITEPQPRMNTLWATDNQLASAEFLNQLTNAREIHLDNNRLANLVVPQTMTNLGQLTASGNLLTNFSLPRGMSWLGQIGLQNNKLKEVTLPRGLDNLFDAALDGNPLAKVAVPADFEGADGRLRGFDPELITYYPTLDIARAAAQAELTWLGGTLQYRDLVAQGEWKDFPGAKSPQAVETTAPMRLFRVRGN